MSFKFTQAFLRVTAVEPNQFIISSYGKDRICNKSKWRNPLLCCNGASDWSCVKSVDIHFVCYHGHILLSIRGPFNYVCILLQVFDEGWSSFNKIPSSETQQQAMCILVKNSTAKLKSTLLSWGTQRKLLSLSMHFSAFLMQKRMMSSHNACPL